MIKRIFPVLLPVVSGLLMLLSCARQSDYVSAIPGDASIVVSSHDLHELEGRGIDTFIEVGPGKTLTGLVKRTLKGATALTCETPEQLDAVLEALGMSDAKEA